MIRIKFFIFSIITLMVINFSCDKVVNHDKDYLVNSLKNSEWILTYLSIGTKNKTENFKNAVFKFSQSGIVIVKDDEITLQGVWSVESENGNYINLDFVEGGKFDDLNGAWTVNFINGKKLYLIDSTGAEGGIDQLKFQN